jgi:hypothetical protein
MTLSNSTKLWLIFSGVYVGLVIILIIGIISTWNAIGQCVVQCGDKCDGGGNPKLTSGARARANNANNQKKKVRFQ